MVNANDSKLNSTIVEFYESISFGLYASPDYERMSRLFIEHAVVCVPGSDGKNFKTMNVPQFIDFAKVNLWPPDECRDGFLEEEIYNETKILSRIAHRFSRYQWRHMVDDERYSEGTNSFQLVLKEGEWKILSLTWERSTRSST